MVSTKATRSRNKGKYSRWEVPDSNATGNDKLLAGKNELWSPNKSHKMYPPEMFGKTMSLIIHALKIIMTNCCSFSY